MKNQTIELPVSELRLALPGLGKLIGRSRHSLPVLAAVMAAYASRVTFRPISRNLAARLLAGRPAGLAR